MPNSEYTTDQIAIISSNLRTVSDETYPSKTAIAADYNATTTYNIGDYCLRNSLFYKCNTAIPSGGEAWNSGHWDQVDVGSELGGAKVHIGADAPLDPNVRFWLDTDEQGTSSVSSVNSKTGTVVLDADDVDAMHWDLLWENASPTSEFAGQTIELNLTNYDAIYCDFVATSGNIIQSVIMKKGEGAYSRYVSSNGSNVRWYHRQTIVDIAGITFNDGVYFTQGTSGNTSINTYLIPYHIYGIKGLFESSI